MKIYAVKTLEISEEKLKKICLSIDSEKRCKIEKFINKKDKVRTLIGEILIRTIIFQELSVRNKHITFEKNEYGKPYMKEHPEFNFNISHSGDFVVCAIDNKPIGIDIEKVKHIEYKEIAKNFFSVRELDYIVKEDLNSQLNKFYEIWTLKESYIKYCGQGLSIPLKSFSIDIDQYENIKVIIDKEHKEPVFKRFDIGSEYKMAVCSVNKEISYNIVMIDQNSLINNYSRFELK
ncbi:4'-phosphopantetheinyl transferase superfamily protein [Clostridium tagluense]|uniref:4'-phosphopantetheinyl transferase family protein n=1 Tax=Clostridium tagluense TaxID=360422 RepID=UPI001CF4B26D|nr:4'-phosphopantetheinyl transferase superfamily protein [Clostridium tagluense]MCB2311591.1 4'-phosphopantetheinyl transferase superfamily protein [Clostridium tagluense]MCB2316315.1 4'-phosphopantetheinyl transferase superfamily protein [Clostridium tagluense]MCB2321170.1 4'-phosphopantetheinyl transferase superfamily protein [Clostridium tagluense]MCB2326184.1 4'-phosphopantetheinyl transferase superfamily protein [Clostridium tagluense]MCB2330907.1 4'-phosphopantetheinyl transferase super